MIREALALTRPAFALTEHLARSAEVSAFTINTARSDAKPYALMEAAAIERMHARAKSGGRNA